MDLSRHELAAAGQVRYIAHREEGLTDGRRRELYGIGERYRALRGDEPAIRRALREDARGLRNPPYFRFIMTVDNPTAERFGRLDGPQSERVMRDAIDETFRGALSVSRSAGTTGCARALCRVFRHCLAIETIGFPFKCCRFVRRGSMPASTGAESTRLASPGLTTKSS